MLCIAIPFVSNAHAMYMVNVSGQADGNFLNSPSVTCSNNNVFNQTNVYRRKSITSSNGIVYYYYIAYSKVAERYILIKISGLS